MAYTKKIWKDYPDATTPILASDLNNIEDGLETVIEKEMNLESKISQLDTKIPIVVYDKSTNNYGYASGIRFPTTPDNSIQRANLPNLTQYSGRTIVFSIRYGDATPVSFLIGGTVGYSIVGKFAGGYSSQKDLWTPSFEIKGLNSTTWELTYKNSLIINDANLNITKDTGARNFYIDRVVIL